MADTEDDGFNEDTFKGFGEDPAQVTPPAKDPAPPATESPKADPPAAPPVGPPKPAEEPKKDEEPAKPSEETPPATPTNEKKEEGDPKPPETPETPAAPEPSQPLTKDDVKSVVSDLLNTERSSTKELETTTTEVLEKYYPEGLSNVLVDERSGKELKTPQDVVDASDGQMSTEEAAQWLMNEQYKLDQSVNKIKNDARSIAETTVNFRRDAITALQKYDPLFKAYPQLQEKVYQKLMKQVKVDKDKGVILSAPDVMEYYDDYLEPYQLAFEHSTNKPSTAPTPDPNEPPKPTAEDRMDESGDGGQSPVDDPNDFAQQVSKELAKGI